MKNFKIVITGQVDDDISDDWIERMAGNAWVQVEEPEIYPEELPPESLDGIEFETSNLDMQVEITAANQ